MNSNNKKQQFIAGCKSALPVILGFVPVGIAYAIMARQAGFSVFQTCSLSLFVFAGASQMMAIGMWTQGAGILAIVLATFILNLRHLIMSTCVMNRMQKSHPALRILAAFGVTDESFAIFITEKKENGTIFFFLGLVLTTYVSWNLGTLAGALASSLLPEIVSASLGIALYAMFIGLLFPSLPGNRRLTLLVALTAVCNTILSRIIPSSWALIASTLLCALAGTFFVELDEEKEVTEDGHN